MSSAVEFCVNTVFSPLLLKLCRVVGFDFLQPWIPAFEKGLINHVLFSFDCINYSEGCRFIVEVLDSKQDVPTSKVSMASCKNLFL